MVWWWLGNAVSAAQTLYPTHSQWVLAAGASITLLTLIWLVLSWSRGGPSPLGACCRLMGCGGCGSNDDDRPSWGGRVIINNQAAVQAAQPVAPDSSAVVHLTPLEDGGSPPKGALPPPRYSNVYPRAMETGPVTHV